MFASPNAFTQSAIVKRDLPGTTSESDGKYTGGQSVVVATLENVDIQPVSAREQEAATKLEQHFDFRAIVFIDDVTLTSGFEILPLDFLELEDGTRYNIISPNFMDINYQMQIKQVV